MKRIDFLKAALGASAFVGLSLAACNDKDSLQELVNNTRLKVNGNMFNFSSNKLEKVRVGIIGLGNRGSVLLQMFQYLVEKEYAEIIALCDIKEKKTDSANSILSKWQTTKTFIYNKSENDWKNLAKRDDIDLIIIATPWRLHTQMSLYCMQNNKHVACEVPIAYKLEDCWKLVQTSEKTKKHCIMLENCNYNSEELWILNMIQEGVFGDITHTCLLYTSPSP